MLFPHFTDDSISVDSYAFIQSKQQTVFKWRNKQLNITKRILFLVGDISYDNSNKEGSPVRVSRYVAVLDDHNTVCVKWNGSSDSFLLDLCD